MIKPIFFFLTCLFISLTSCEEIRHKSRDFQYIEELMPHHPDSALALLNKIKSTKGLSRKDRAYYYLLLTEAEDKNHVKHETDSLITIATDYYEKTDDWGRRAKAWYYKGRINQDLGHPLKAQEYYLNALTDEERIKDYALLGRINNHIGILYTYQEVFDKALPFLKKAVENYRIIGDSTGQAFASRDLGRTFLMLGFRDSAIISNQKAIALMREKAVPSVYTELASLYIKEKRMEEAYELLQTALRNVVRPQAKYPTYIVLGKFYKESGQIDSARFYLQACVDSAPQPVTRAGGLFHLKEIALTEKRWEQAALLSKRYETLRDSVVDEQQTELIRRNQTLYSYTEMDQELWNARLYASDIRYRYHISMICCLFALCGIILYYIHYKRKKKTMEKQLDENETRICKHEQTIRELSMLKENLLQDINTYKNNQELLAETNKRLHDLSNIKQRLDQELTTLKNENLTLKKWRKEKEDLEKQFQGTELYQNFHSSNGWEPTQENWDTLFSSVDQCYPSFPIGLRKSVPLTESEKKICYLTKINVRPGVIAILLHLENVSIYRKRLYEKLSGQHGTAKDLDKYIDEL